MLKVFCNDRFGIGLPLGRPELHVLIVCSVFYLSVSYLYSVLLHLSSLVLAVVVN